ncbi:MAG: APC family permease [Streptosporangiaceae bacterium]
MTENSTSPTLRRNTLGLVAVATMGAVVMSPAIGIFALFPVIEQTTGRIAPIIFLLTLLISLPTAISYAMVARNMASAGGGYTWLWNSTRPSIGLWLGWNIITYYEVAVVAVIAIFGLFFEDAVQSVFGIAPGLGVWIIGLLVAIGLIALFTYLNIQVSARVALGFLLFEALTILALAVTILIVRGHQGVVNAQPLNLANATDGFNGIMLALVIGVFSFAGYEIVSTVAEEAKTPKRYIPAATVLSLVLVGVFWAFTSYGFSFGVSLSKLNAIAATGVTTPVTPIARIFWGGGDAFVIIAGLTSTLAVCLSDIVATSRTMYAMSRDSVIPSWFSRIHERHHTPWNALHVLIAIGIVVPILSGIWIGPTNTVNWWVTAMVFFALCTYLFVNFANIAYHWRYRRDQFNWITNFLVPVVGILIDGFVLYRGFFVSLWGAGFEMGQSIIYFSVLWAVLGAAFAYWRLRKLPQLRERKSFILEHEAPAEELGGVAQIEAE